MNLGIPTYLLSVIEIGTGETQWLVWIQIVTNGTLTLSYKGLQFALYSNLTGE